MEIIRGIHNLKLHHYGCVLTIGNFDGFHLGHHKLIKQLKIVGNNLSLPIMVIVFEPQPKEFFYRNYAPNRLSPFRDKLKYLSSAGVNFTLCILFNKKFACISAEYFVKYLLIEKLGVKIIYVGNDFRFGNKRKGNFKLLKIMGNQNGFEVFKIDPYIQNGKRVSSTAIRKALINDNLLEAEILLGHPYKISGLVIHGKGFGRIIGFPTANILIKNNNIPLHGVYLVEVYKNKKKIFPGIANIGFQPTFGKNLKKRLEVHILGNSIDLYGQHIEIIIRKKVRIEKKFDSIEKLKLQIFNDVIFANKYFKL